MCVPESAAGLDDGKAAVSAWSASLDCKSTHCIVLACMLTLTLLKVAAQTDAEQRHIYRGYSKVL